jgi:surfactin synthase thioesterase subunit
MTTPDPWLCRFAPHPDAELRLVCFPHAGASASVYSRWAQALAFEIELVAVQYPGRAERSREAVPDSMADLVAGVRDALLADIDRPYALFGHGMGAAVAYETALALRDAPCQEPRHLFLSGRTPAGPDLVPGLASGDEEARAALVPAFAADRRLLETYRPTPAVPALFCPVTALTGSHDPLTDIPAATRWAAITTGPFGLSVFPGDHFYLTAHATEVAALVSTLLQPDVPAAG